MKKILVAACLIAITNLGISQTCEQRENKLLEAFGGFSAAMLYNTYGLIGSISDGFTHNAYDAVTVSDLLGAQKKVAENLEKVLEDLNTGGFLKDEKDKDFANAMISILKGLKKQAQLLEIYTDRNNRQNQEAYENQRNKNWSAISNLMGIEE